MAAIALVVSCINLGISITLILKESERSSAEGKKERNFDALLKDETWKTPSKISSLKPKKKKSSVPWKQQ